MRERARCGAAPVLVVATILLVATGAAGQPSTTADPSPSDVPDHAAVVAATRGDDRPLDTTAAAGGRTHPAERAQLERAATELEAIQQRSRATRRSLFGSLLGAGIGAAVYGGVLLVPDGYDHAGRTAGMSLALFGVVNAIIGGVALAGLESSAEESNSPEARLARRTASGLQQNLSDALAQERSSAVTFAVNLGLDAAYAVGGGLAIAVSQLGVDHPNRWLGAGVVVAGQAVHLAIIDLIGLMSSTARHDELTRLLRASPAVGPAPAGAELRWGTDF